MVTMRNTALCRLLPHSKTKLLNIGLKKIVVALYEISTVISLYYVCIVYPWPSFNRYNVISFSAN
jgi:hypothetical protein